MRTRQVYPTNEIAHLWAHQTQDSARNPGNSNFYFRGKTIYSYRDSYPIATLFGENNEKVFFRLSSYSNTTSKHIGHARGAVSHLEKIWCHVPPTYFNSGEFYFLSDTNRLNFEQWQRNIENLFEELGNKRNRDIQGRLNRLSEEIRQVKHYASVLEIQVPPELVRLIDIANDPEILDKAREAKSQADLAEKIKLEEATKIFNEKYLPLWRDYDTEAISEISDKDISIIRNYQSSLNSFTRLRYDKIKERVETSKGVQIPVEIAKGVYFEIKDCLTGSCKGLNIPVLHYTITKVDSKSLVAGCHEIPVEDINYIANLLGWVVEEILEPAGN